MKTKKFFMSLFMAAVAMGGFSACSDDEPVNKGQNGQDGPEGEGVYMSLTVKMPSVDGSRSQTVTPGESNDGFENGTDAENNVSNVIIVIANSKDNSFVVAGEVLKNNLHAIPTANSYKTVVKMSKTKLNDYYDDDNYQREVNIFVFCNPTEALKTTLSTAVLGDTDWYNLTCSVLEQGSGSGADKVEALNTGIWSDNGFLMSNTTIDTRLLPENIGDWDAYKTEATAFDFSGINQAGQDTEVDNSTNKNRGPIKVRRAVARFDFRDGSQDAPDPSGVANTYNVVKGKEVNGVKETLVQVTLNRMSLVNMCNSFYYLPRMSPKGTPTGAVLCGQETPENYLVGPYWNAFSGEVMSGFKTYFNFSFFNEDGNDYNRANWFTSTVDNVLGGKGDLYEGPDHNGKPYEPGTYKVWRYATPNLIPGEPSNQQNGISTGVVFEGQMMPTEACKNSDDKYLKLFYDYTHKEGGMELTGDPQKDPILYSFSGSLYFTWDNVREQAIANAVTYGDELDGEGKPTGKLTVTNINRSEPLYVAVFGNGGIGTIEVGKIDNVPYYYTDNLPEDVLSANYIWKEWDTANRPASGNLYDKMRTTIVAQGFTIYQSAKVGNTAGYFCYYFYWNRHNDNLKNGVMGPMEFCVVRNNVYKLAVTNIKQLGHPRIPTNDPDSPKPDTPDESDDVYLTVTCDVVPWVVRINNIEF